MSNGAKRQRMGIFGGTFDPIHVGHLLIAEQAREQLLLDQVRFVPAAISPHKLGQQPTDSKHRLEMVRLAIGGNSQFVADDRELQRGGTSYTVDTLSDLRNQYPESELVFIMGGDSLAELHTWRDPARICKLAFVAVLARGGQSKPDLESLKRFLPTEQRASLADHLIATPQIEISSSDLRSRISQGRTTRYQLHPAVEAYIAANRLYR